MLGKKTATMLTKPYGLQSELEHKHYNQLLSINKLLSPRLKIHRQDFICAIMDIFSSVIIFNAVSNHFVMSDIMNNHIPRVPFDDLLASLYRNPLCESSGIFHSLLHRFGNPKPNAGNQIINQLGECQKN